LHGAVELEANQKLLWFTVVKEDVPAATLSRLSKLLEQFK